MSSDLDLVLAALDEVAHSTGMSGLPVDDSIAEVLQQLARNLRQLRAEAVADSLPVPLSQAGELIRDRDRWQREAERLKAENDELREKLTTALRARLEGE